MERRKVQQPVSPAYPAHASLTPALARRVALAAVLAAPLVACSTIQHVDGLMEEPTEPWAVDLPAEGTHTVALSGEGAEEDYHLELVVDDLALDCLSAQGEAALVEVDAVLADEPAAAFEEGADPSAIEDLVTQSLATFCEVGTGEFLETDLVVDDLRWLED